MTGLTLDDYLERSNFLVYLYKESTTDRAWRSHQENLLKQQRNIQSIAQNCDAQVQCRNKGVCAKNTHDNNTFSCSCFFNQAGDYCSYKERELQILNNVSYIILFNLQQMQLTDNIVLKIAKILENLAQIDDALNKKSFRLYQIISNNIVKFDMPHTELHRIMIESLSSIIYQTVTRPSLRPDEKIKWSQIFKTIFENLLVKLQGLIRMNDDFIFKNLYITLAITKKRGREYNSAAINSANKIVFPLDKSIVSLPRDLFGVVDINLVRIVQFNFNPNYPNTNVVTSQLDINVFGQNNELRNIQGLSDEGAVELYMMKLASYQPIRTDLSRYYKCSYLEQLNFGAFNWINDTSCTYETENEFFIKVNSLNLKNLV